MLEILRINPVITGDSKDFQKYLDIALQDLKNLGEKFSIIIGPQGWTSHAETAENTSTGRVLPSIGRAGPSKLIILERPVVLLKKFFLFSKMRSLDLGEIKLGKSPVWEILVNKQQ